VFLGECIQQSAMDAAEGSVTHDYHMIPAAEIADKAEHEVF
jgi:hypothetical protein